MSRHAIKPESGETKGSYASWWVREVPRIFFIGLIAGIVTICGYLWPHYAVAIWAMFLAAVAYYLYVDLRRPVNYKSIVVSENSIEYVALTGRSTISFDMIEKVEFVREEALFPDLHGPYLETKWLVQMAGSDRVELMDEWPHRSLLLRTFIRHLPGFDEVAAKTGLKARREGRWLCYERRPAVRIDKQ